MKSGDDTNVTVTENNISGGNGVVVAGSSGEVKANTIATGKAADNVGIDVGKSPSANAPKGPVKVDGKDHIDKNGKATGVRVVDRSDATISDATIQGKGRSTGPGIHAVLAAGTPPGASSRSSAAP